MIGILMAIVGSALGLWLLLVFVARIDLLAFLAGGELRTERRQPTLSPIVIGLSFVLAALMFVEVLRAQ